MTKPTVDEALGVPGDEVTHWGISRVLGYKRNPTTGRRLPEMERLTAPRPDGVRINEWPLDELTLENVRARWGHGTFRAHWFILDPENAQADHRRISGGNGAFFTLDEEKADEPEPGPLAAAPLLPAFPAGQDPMTAALGFAQTLMTLADARTNSTIEAVARMAGRNPGDGGNAEVLARMASLEAKITADAERRALEDAHRAELAKKDAEIAELKREAEREADDRSNAPMFEPGTPFLEQLAYAALNIATKHPEIVAPLVGPVLERLAAKKAEPEPAPAAPVQVQHVQPPAPPAQRTAYPGGPPIQRPADPRPMRQPSPVHIVRRPPVPPAEESDNPLTPAVTAKAADPVVTPPEAAASPS